MPYVSGEEAPTIGQWGQILQREAVASGITATLGIEPGRAIVASAAITAYTVGTIKKLDGIRNYVAVDGGMSDNPRPVLYGSGYETFLPRSVLAERPMSARIVGKHCESGDILVREADLPEDLAVGDILATPVTGAYGHSMGSNYNKVLRPPVVFCADGDAAPRRSPGDLRRPPRHRSRLTIRSSDVERQFARGEPAGWPRRAMIEPMRRVLPVCAAVIVALVASIGPAAAATAPTDSIAESRVRVKVTLVGLAPDLDGGRLDLSANGQYVLYDRPGRGVGLYDSVRRNTTVLGDDDAKPFAVSDSGEAVLYTSGVSPSSGGDPTARAWPCPPAEGRSPTWP